MEPGPGAGPNNDPVGQALNQPELLGLPNSPEFIGAETALLDELSRALERTGIERALIPAEIAKFKARFETDTGLRERDTTQEMASRGLMGSSIASRAEFEAEIPESRAWRDYLGQQEARYGGLAQQELGALDAYRRARQGMLYDYRGNLMDNPTSAVYQGNRDYYDPGGGDEAYYSADQGYTGNYSDYKQPTRPSYIEKQPKLNPLNPRGGPGKLPPPSGSKKKGKSRRKSQKAGR